MAIRMLYFAWVRERDRHGRGDGRSARERRDGGAIWSTGWRRASAGHADAFADRGAAARGGRPGVRAARRADRRRARGRDLPAGDRRMIRVSVQRAPIDIAAEIDARRRRRAAGAVATFTGLVRADDGVGDAGTRTLSRRDRGGAAHAWPRRRSSAGRWRRRRSSTASGRCSRASGSSSSPRRRAHRARGAGGLRVSDRPAEDRRAVLEARDARRRRALGRSARWRPRRRGTLG